MKKVRITFELYEGNVEDLPPGYKEVSCHMIFDVNMGESFRRKTPMAAGGHNTTTPSPLTYSSVVSRERIRIDLTIYALNGLKVLACNIQNEYLTEKRWEKIWNVTGPFFGPEQGNVMLVVRTLYGLKSPVAAFRSLLAEQLHGLGYMSSIYELDVWMRPSVKPGGFMHYEYVLCYVNDVIYISDDPLCTMKGIQDKFKLKGYKIEEPEMYLGEELSNMTNVDGQ